MLTAVLGAIVLFKALTIETEGGDPVGRFAWRPLIVIVLAITVFGILLPRLGMVLTMPMLIIIASLAGDEFRWGRARSARGADGLFLAHLHRGLKLTIPLWPSFLAT